ncbi:Nif3-like dinuclear metal center hexameric protein [Candidatus Woesearchaeota archaeon]|jgi:dinuclear metal center YbgI/SA1388 family protein|nr:Nif3-like dinuclear metal center hexameric protein [Candidatus Woesearchaeota archaeon]MBT5397311.1 Nif3-like dinuclear metal center hexameric protein [Candidatus Woesearchaeota archaeon]MBT5924792.1 Nif3-like dinuclear metal center hexameric protein [Candidatus Woesearchaeota archaeon]MBT6367844.1 Nif3-like dinuclear metal center hexameric protein [Candidatus Woesearchaeota archaeon]MBT7762711.1 Nif3-like dinuclear metal center hexameric protein [Candidatus Woesearchaeota archaeon]
MASSIDIAQFLNKELQIYNGMEDSSCNGLQVQNTGNVTKVGFAVDACMETFQKAAESGCHMLITHHGLIWYGIKSVTRKNYTNIKFLFDNNLALYGVHLPLDMHPLYGNNIQLAKMLGLKDVRPFGRYKKEYGYVGKTNTTLKKVQSILQKNGMKTDTLAFGKERIRSVAIVSGGAASDTDEAIKRNVDLFVTGEPLHYVYHLAKEAKINVIFGGHYETEVWGVKALMSVIKRKFKVNVEFIDVPTSI